ncbi:ROK family transcriptional regulator [Peribacillus loiseleuriae]|uniref:ROK family transcriptional regulator n=1 Tax=Peribacillus loiseleuriae TaxID=1679170 RepID=A0A0K9GTH8_9BACI|nr:ROK family transcriptional regulator [Peribacillus loiseleuriae]KMY49933.1 ROK family transcriptional regulator [Peribacillus loiseleuriae]
MDKRFATPKSMKKVILRVIRTTLLQFGSATKVELSKRLGISFPTVSKVVAQMERDGEVYVVGLDDSSGGRRAKRYAFNPEHMLGLAVFLEENETVYAVFNCVGEVKEQGTRPSVFQDGLHLLIELVQDILLEFPKISSMAIGVPGAVDNGRIFHIPNYKSFHDFELKTYFENLFSIPIVVENDMNAAVLGFQKRSGREDKQSLVYLYSGKNGPGAGILINGDVVRGSTFFTGEISFMPLYDNQNFHQAMYQGRKNTKTRTIGEKHEIHAISRLMASLVAIINPHTVIFSKEEMDQIALNRIAIESTKYVPKEHLPELIVSDWKRDYLHGLQRLALDRMVTGIRLVDVLE